MQENKKFMRGMSWSATIWRLWDITREQTFGGDLRNALFVLGERGGNLTADKIDQANWEVIGNICENPELLGGEPDRATKKD